MLDARPGLAGAGNKKRERSILFEVVRYRQFWHARHYMMPIIVEARTKAGAIRIAKSQTPMECDYAAYLMVGATLKRWAKGVWKTMRDWT